jgi:hypothetical protein
LKLLLTKAFFTITLYALIYACSETKVKKIQNHDEINEWAIFKGIDHFEGEGYRVNKSMATNKLNLTAVLVYYNIPVRYNEIREIEIPKTHFSDSNYLYNITLKSLDSTWMKRHILLSSDSAKSIF